jgi:hypothetical protein
VDAHQIGNEAGDSLVSGFAMKFAKSSESLNNCYQLLPDWGDLT